MPPTPGIAVVPFDQHQLTYTFDALWPIHLQRNAASQLIAGPFEKLADLILPWAHNPQTIVSPDSYVLSSLVSLYLSRLSISLYLIEIMLVE